MGARNLLKLGSYLPQKLGVRDSILLDEYILKGQLSPLRKTVLDCKSGKRLLKRFTSQNAEKDFLCQVFQSKYSKNEEFQVLCQEEYCLTFSQTQQNIKAIWVRLQKHPASTFIILFTSQNFIIVYLFICVNISNMESIAHF